MVERKKLVPLETVLKFNESFPEDFNLDIDDFFKNIAGKNGRNYLFDSEYVAYMLELFFPAMSEDRIGHIINNGWTTGLKKNLTGNHFKRCAIGKRTKILEEKCKCAGELYKYADYGRMVKSLCLNLSKHENNFLYNYFVELKERTKEEGMLEKSQIDEYRLKIPFISNYIDSIDRYFISNGIRPHKGLRVKKKIETKTKKRGSQMDLFS